MYWILKKNRRQKRISTGLVIQTRFIHACLKRKEVGSKKGGLGRKGLEGEGLEGEGLEGEGLEGKGEMVGVTHNIHVQLKQKK